MTTLGQQIIEAMEEALREGLIRVYPSPNVANLRASLKMTQTAFAKMYHLNINTLRKWENRTRPVDGVARAFLMCIQKDPATIDKLLNEERND